jgi:hypothetical protein
MAPVIILLTVMHFEYRILTTNPESYYLESKATMNRWYIFVNLPNAMIEPAID